MTDYRQRRQELLEKLIEKRKHDFSQSSVKKLNELYGLNLDTTNLNEYSEIDRYYCLNRRGHYGHLNQQGYTFSSTGFLSSKLIANLMCGREMSDWEVKQFNLPDAVNVARENLKYGSWYGGGCMGMNYYAIDDTSDKVRQRTLTREEFEEQITGRITGANNDDQRRLIKLYKEFKRNGEFYHDGSSHPESFPPIGWGEKNKEISEEEWESYKKKYLNPNREVSFDEEKEKLGIWSRINSYFSRK